MQGRFTVSSTKKFDVFGVGNAIVDTLAQVNDTLISELGVHKGSMSLMDAENQAAVLSALDHQQLQLASGGSAANTMVAVAQSGGTGVYFGKVAHDTNGEFYKHDMQNNGIAFPVALAPEASLPTGTCVVLTTPDAERTMCTHLGISTTLHASDIDSEVLRDCKMSYIEGYLWDADEPRAACIEAFEQSKRLGVRAAFTFSDAFLIDRFADDFRRVVADYCDVLFCNADEAKQFFGCDDIDACSREMAKICELAFITNGGEGCLVLESGQITKVPGFPVTPIDTNGAGDAFAGGTLYGLTHEMRPTQAAKWGNYFASRVVEVMGPRLNSGLSAHRSAIIGS